MQYLFLLYMKCFFRCAATKIIEYLRGLKFEHAPYIWIFFIKCFLSWLDLMANMLLTSITMVSKNIKDHKKPTTPQNYTTKAYVLAIGDTVTMQLIKQRPFKMFCL